MILISSFLHINAEIQCKLYADLNDKKLPGIFPFNSEFSQMFSKFPLASLGIRGLWVIRGYKRGIAEIT